MIARVEAMMQLFLLFLKFFSGFFLAFGLLGGGGFGTLFSIYEAPKRTKRGHTLPFRAIAVRQWVFLRRNLANLAKI